MTTGAALQLVTLFGLAYATDSHLPGISPMAAVSIFIDGTKDILPTNDSQAPDRMRGALNGAYDQCAVDCANNKYIVYPREFGVMTGLGSHGYEESKAIAAEKTKAAILDAVSQNPGDPVYVVGFSQGSNAASDVLADLEKEYPNKDFSKVTFVLLGNGARNDGGLWARMPAGVYVPLIGLRFGASTNPSTNPNAPQVIQISKQYDGASDVPKYVMNPVAWANAALGFIYVHNGYYNDVSIADLDTDGDGRLSQDEIDDAPEQYVITQEGNIVDVLIKNPEGQLPLTRPLLDLGVPPEIVKALDPLLRAIIETGYDRPIDGKYPAKPVHLELIPDPHQWIEDFHAIAAGMEQTQENLEELNHANLMQANTVAPESNLKIASEGSTDLDAKPAATPPAPTGTETSGGGVTAAYTQPAAPVTTQTVPVAPATPVVQPVVTPPVQQAPASTGGEAATPSTSKPQVNLNKSLQQINKAITGTVNTVVGALTPKPRSGGTTTTQDPSPATQDPGPTESEPSGGNEPANDSEPAA
ncbi:PE-PPE domain-containing protein [Mycobacterium sp. IS-1742]|uniref:PE-PPE domain-containing protein n=1 Tax=Mycobacterium sp. IS-1742 TaxID=1772285 RepID=UPI001E3CCF5D|nr:PE-PPE domain-containing protein [Mycobacterium sp. IS-1742]